MVRNGYWHWYSTVIPMQHNFYQSAFHVIHNYINFSTEQKGLETVCPDLFTFAHDYYLKNKQINK